jgi:glycerophosphoryl diester phosphodiesterase
MTKTCPATNLYHKDDPYREGNSLHGLEEALKLKRDWIDWDAQESKDHALWNMHWAWLYQDKFAFKGGVLARTGRRRVKNLTNKQLTKVKSKDGFKPHLYTYMLGQAARNHVNLEIELKEKASHQALLKVMVRIANLQKSYPDFHIRVKILQGVLHKFEILEEFAKVQAVATTAGAQVHTMYLNHSDKPVKFTDEQQKVVDLVRGKWQKV